MKKMELLAPAGNFECLVAAVQSGADAVYLSGKGFGARSFADNFDEAELEKVMDYCHIRGVRVYVTVNTLVSDDEIEELCRYLKFLNRIGTDGIIVQDLGVLQIAKSVVPQLPVHASTQMTVCSSEGVRFLEKNGIKRIVLAREVSLESIKKISETTCAELEVFGHGALCMCYSGQCLMSSIIGGRSGNRGKCAQPCRLMYDINKKGSAAYFMSLKDLCALSYVKELESAGVASLKIEGRMKGAAYVAAVVSIYRKYIDNPGKVEKADLDMLDAIFNRGGLTDGYLTEKTGKTMFAFNKPDNPYLKGTEDLVNKLKEQIRYENRKLKLKCDITIKKGEFPLVVISGDEFKTEYKGEVRAEDAKNAPLNESTIKARFNKTGGTSFVFDEINVDIDENIFLTAGALNGLRRSAIETFEKGYLATFRRQEFDLNLPRIGEANNQMEEFVCEVTTLKQFESVKELPYRLFYVPLHIILGNRELFCDYKEKTVIVPPAIIAENTQNSVFAEVKELLDDGFYGVLANNIAFCDFSRKYRVLGGFRLNVFNSYALDFYKSCGFLAAELSPELNLKQIKGISKTLPVGVMVYGRLPVMITENCVIRNGDECGSCNNGILTDRMGLDFPVIKDGNSCRSVILNCKKTFMAFDMDKVKNAGVSFYRIYFTDESFEECRSVSESFLKGGTYRPEDFTRGHFIKGVQ
ncbi:MAG: U32 family peptidase [Clostridia bacterium]|nr:U32 family peptidase [Clostridia bacterium]